MSMQRDAETLVSLLCVEGKKDITLRQGSQVDLAGNLKLQTQKFLKVVKSPFPIKLCHWYTFIYIHVAVLL